MATPKGLNIDFKSSPNLTSPLATVPITANDLSDTKMDLDHQDQQDQQDFDNIEKLKEFELLPTLYNLLLDVQTGVIKSKDFDNNAGSLRLKLITAKKILRDINGINESVASRIEKIDEIKYKNNHKYDLLMKFNRHVADQLNEEDKNLENGAKSTVNEENNVEKREKSTIINEDDMDTN